MTPKDRIALIIASGIITWGILALSGSIYRNKPLSEGGSEFFATVGGAMVAMLVTYFTRNNGNG